MKISNSVLKIKLFFIIVFTFFLIFILGGCKTTKRVTSNSTNLVKKDSIENTITSITINEDEDLKEVVTESITEKLEIQYDTVTKRSITTPIKLTKRKIEIFNKKNIQTISIQDKNLNTSSFVLKDTSNFNRETVGQEVVQDISKGLFEGIFKAMFGDLFKSIVLYIIIFVMIIVFIIVIRKNKQNQNGRK